MGERIRAAEWSRSALGAVDQWPQSLRSAVGICLNTAFPMAIYWGPDLALLYNDAWSPIPGEKHPWALGRPGKEVWPEIWPQIGPLFERVQSSGEGVWQQDQLLPMRRHGYTEECYFNFTFSPIRGESGDVAGIFNAVIETTARVIEERRVRALRDLAMRGSVSESLQQACERLMRVLAANPLDIPFACLYLLDDRADEFRLAGHSGCLPEELRPAVLPVADGVAVWPLQAVLEDQQARVIELPRSQPFSTPLWPEERLSQAILLPV
ncbi:MAG: PAS domain-containing protein, partial [Sinobacteraceae bacterium]|nr:PAS domain-containing protein [Nevskiaceae bacterium]